MTLRGKLSNNLKKYRKKANLSQEEIADSAGISTRYYQMLESKKPASVTLDTLEKLAKSLKVPSQKLIEN